MYGKKRRRIAQIMALLLLAILLLSLIFGGCSARPGESAPETDTPIRVVVTIFPIYDWTRQVIGDQTDAELTLLMDSGVDMHSFQPTAQDILTISSCDVFIHIGGESDAWVDAVLKERTNPDMIVLNLLEALGDLAREEELPEGAQDDHAHEEVHDHEEHDPDENVYDEHIWLSLKNASFLVGVIADALSEADPSHATQYAEAAADYRSEGLDVMDARYRETVDLLPGRVLLFGDRFPFLYLAKDYGLTCYAAFAGCSAETEASFETIAFLSDKADEYNLSCILTIEGCDGRIAQTVIQNTARADQKILSLDSMQATTSKDIEQGATYLGIMEKNLQILSEALR